MGEAVIYRHTLRVACEPGDLAAIVAAIEALGHAVECPVFDEWSRLRARDALLRAAHGLMSGTPWGRCVQLAAEIHRFEALVWPRWRERETPPEGCSALRRHLFEARRLGPLPSTARQFRNIIAKWPRRCDFAAQPLQSANRDPE